MKDHLLSGVDKRARSTVNADPLLTAQIIRSSTVSVNKRDTAIGCRSGVPLSALVSSSYILPFTGRERLLSHVADKNQREGRRVSLFGQFNAKIDMKFQAQNN